MKKAIQISIPTPCHENWEKMDAVEKGRFCGSCQKTVIDFSTMSDRDIAQFFKRPSTGSVCGRFNDDQLGRDMAIPKKRIPWLRYFFQMAIPALLFSKASGQTGKPAKMDRIPDNDSIKVKAGHELKVLGMILSPTIVPEEKKTAPVIKPVDYLTTIKGRVVNEKGEPVAMARIRINEGASLVADGNGAFCIPVDNLAGDSVLYVSSTGFMMEKVLVKKEDAVESEFLIHMRIETPAVSAPMVHQVNNVNLQQGLTGKLGGLVITGMQIQSNSNWEPRLFGRVIRTKK